MRLRRREKFARQSQAGCRTKDRLGQAVWLDCEALEGRRYLSGYTFITRGTFGPSTGDAPFAPLIMDSQGNLYGTTVEGTGNVFEIASGTDTIVVKATFTPTDGETPRGMVMDSNGDLFGTTSTDGANNVGTIFEITAASLASASPTITPLASFSNAVGEEPLANPIIDSNGNLYGTTSFGGASGDGTVWEMTAANIASAVDGDGTINSIASLDGADGYDSDYAPLLRDANGDLFGTASSQSTGGGGTVFEIAAGNINLQENSVVTTLYTFPPSPVDSSSFPNGYAPEGGVIEDSNGNLFGTTSAGGGDNVGEIYEIATENNNTFSIVDSFDRTDGAGPQGNLLMDSAGDLFGTAETGGAGLTTGVVYEVANSGTVANPSFGSINDLVTFNGSNGESPQVGMIMDSNGNLYGTTDAGGSGGNNDGNVFELSPTSTSSATQLQFSQQPNSTTVGNPFNPSVSVDVEDSSGNIVSTDDSAVTLSITGNPAGVSLNGTITVDAQDGVATFPGVSVSAAGTYTLSAADGALAGAVSHPFTISAAAVYTSAVLPQITKSTVPADVVGGVLIHRNVTVSLTNQSTDLIHGPVVVGIYADLDGTIVDPDAPIATLTRSLGIRSDQPKSETLSITSFPSDLAGQTYDLIAQVTDPSGNLNISAAGPSVDIEVPFIALQESVLRLTLPQTMVSGASIHAMELLKITNSGDIPAAGFMPITVFASSDGSTNDGNYKTVDPHLSLKPGMSTDVSVPLRTVPAGLSGNYVTLAQVTDRDGNITSVNSNQSLAIAPPIVTLTAAVIAAPSSSVKIGHSASLAVAITNNGNVDSASPLNIVLGLSSDDATQTAVLLNKDRILKIKPGENLVLHLQFVANSSLLAGQYWPTVTVTDADGNTSGLQISTLIVTLG